MKAEFDRHLAAVLALDIVGFSRLMDADEQRTLARLIARRDTAIDPAMHAHRGRIIKGTGDGILATFVSAQEAIRAALEARAGLDAANLAELDEPPMLVRIGINIGDILFEEDGDIFGDGVNIAARLEATAPPGGICVSGRALDDLRRVGVPYSDHGGRAEEYCRSGARSVYRARGHAPRGAPCGRAAPPPALAGTRYCTGGHPGRCGVGGVAVARTGGCASGGLCRTIRCAAGRRRRSRTG